MLHSSLLFHFTVIQLIVQSSNRSEMVNHSRNPTVIQFKTNGFTWSAVAVSLGHVAVLRQIVIRHYLRFDWSKTLHNKDL